MGTPHKPYPADNAATTAYARKDITPPEDGLVVHSLYKKITQQQNGDWEVSGWSQARMESELKAYYASITFMDRLLGELVIQLKDQGLYENTIVIFTSDNGLSVGSHAIDGKANLFEFGGMHVPLVMAGPGIAQGVSEALVYLYDLFPTLMDMTGTKTPPSAQGKSLAKVLGGQQASVRDALLTVYTKGSELRALRNDRWKIMHFLQSNTFELYDLDNDPRELKNLAGEPAFAGQLDTMKELLRSERQRVNDSFPEGNEHYAQVSQRQSPAKAGSKHSQVSASRWFVPGVEVAPRQATMLVRQRYWSYLTSKRPWANSRRAHWLHGRGGSELRPCREGRRRLVLRFVTLAV